VILKTVLLDLKIHFMKKIKGVKLGNVEVVLKGERDWNKDYDFGALTLKCEDREFILDVVQSYTETTKTNTKITLKIEPDENIFDECPYNLTKEDLIEYKNNCLIRELFIDGTFENEIVSIILYFEIDGQNFLMPINREE
jgi:hypothetical protein